MSRRFRADEARGHALITVIRSVPSRTVPKVGRMTAVVTSHRRITKSEGKSGEDGGIGVMSRRYRVGKYERPSEVAPARLEELRGLISRLFRERLAPRLALLRIVGMTGFARKDDPASDSFARLRLATIT